MSVGEQGNLLVVDDEPEIREIISLYLSEIGFTVLEACDGEQGIEVLKSQEIDVVLSDLMMPRMSGMTFLETIRGEGISVPFIFVTAYPSRDSTVQALRLGAFDYLEKPFDREHLQTLVKEAMRVAKEQKSLSREALASTDGDLDNPDPVMIEILKMRTLRYRSDDASEGRRQEARIRELFVSEAEPQLLFATGAIKGLRNPENRVWELGYLFRVMQAVATAAQAIEAEAVRALADACQRCYTTLRVRPRSCTDEVIEVLDEANEALRELVGSVGHGAEVVDSSAVIARLVAITNELDENSADPLSA